MSEQELSEWACRHSEFLQSSGVSRISSPSSWGSCRIPTRWLFHVFRSVLNAIPLMVSSPGIYRAALQSFWAIDQSSQPVRFSAHCRDSGAELRRGITLDVDHLDGMLMPVRNLAIVRLSPRNHMAIIAEFVSNFRDWKSFFFFVRIDNASMEESCIPILRTRWGRKDTFDWLHASLDDIQS